MRVLIFIVNLPALACLVRGAEHGTKKHGDVDYDDHGGDDEEDDYDDAGEGQEGRDKLL